MPKTIAEIMDTHAPTVTTDAPIEEVVRVFKESGIGGVPVVNDGGRCVGFITEDDLVIPDAEGDLHIPHYIELFGGLIFLESTKHYEERIKKAAALTAKDVMTENPTTIESTATPREAGKLMSARHHSRLPVVDHGRCVGLVTRADVLAAVTAED